MQIDHGSSDTYSALKGTDPLEADLLSYSLTTFSQNEPEGGRSGSLPFPYTRHESSLEHNE